MSFRARRSFRRSSHKRSTDWIWYNLENFGVGPGSVAQDWIIPPFGDPTHFPDFLSWNHATVTKIIMSLRFFRGNGAAPVDIGGLYFGILACPEDPATGNPLNMYTPGDNGAVEWLYRLPLLPYVGTGANFVFDNWQGASLPFEGIVKAQRRLTDQQGLAYVVENLSTESNTANIAVDFRALVKMGAGGSLA